MGKTKLSEIRLSLRALAYLLRYPNAEMRAGLPDVRTALIDESAISPERMAELKDLISHLIESSDLIIEAEYVEMFDRGHRTSLLLFEHVHGDSRDRGPAMVDLMQTYEKAGLYLHADQMPDDLPVVLEFASSQPSVQARSFLSETAHIVRAIYSALSVRQSGYACVLASVLELVGESVQTVPVEQEPEIDEQWQEPEVFGGCSSVGQTKPGEPQPIKIMPRATMVPPVGHQGVQQ